MPINVSLVMFKTDGTRRDFPVTRKKIVVGRKHDCDLRIPLTSVSRKHCELQIDDEQVKMRDLGSSNGTYHNNIRVQEANLSAGDEVVIGPVVFTIVVDGQPEQIKPVRTILDDSNQNESSPGQGFETQADHASVGSDSSSHEQTNDVQAKQVEAEQTAPTVDMDESENALESTEHDQNQNDASGSHVASQAGSQTGDDEIEIISDDDQDNKS